MKRLNAGLRSRTTRVSNVVWRRPWPTEEPREPAADAVPSTGMREGYSGTRPRGMTFSSLRLLEIALSSRASTLPPSSASTPSKLAAHAYHPVDKVISRKLSDRPSSA